MMSVSQENAFGLIWDENKKLTWNDFQGNYPSWHSFSATTFTDTKFTYSWEFSETSKCNYEFTDVFAKSYFDNRSWVVKDEKSDWLLNHEQRHFDIAQIFAGNFNERVRTELLDKQFSCPTFRDTNSMSFLTKKQLDTIFYDEQRKAQRMQNDYDRNTDHGKNSYEQIQWNKKIDSKLKELKENAQKQKIIDQLNDLRKIKNQRPTNEIDFDFFKGYPELVKIIDDENSFYTVSGYVSDVIYTRGFPLELFVKSPDSSVKQSQIAVTSEQYFEFPLMFGYDSQKGEYKIILHYKGIEVYSEHIVVGSSANEIDSIKNNSITIASNCTPIPDQKCTPYQQIMRGETGTYLITGSFANNSLMPATMKIQYPSGEQESFSVPSKLITEYKKFYEYPLAFTWESERGVYIISVYSPQHLYIQKVVLNVGPKETLVDTPQLLKRQDTPKYNHPPVDASTGLPTSPERLAELEQQKNVLDIMQANLDKCNFFGSCDEKPDEAEIIQNTKPDSPKKTTIRTQLAGFDRLFIHVDMQPVADYYRSKPYSIELLCFPHNNEIASTLQTLLKNEPTYLELIAHHAQTIKCEGADSKIRIKLNGQPSILIQKNILPNLGVDWFTSIIGHEACHSKQYFDYLKDNPQYASVPVNIYKGDAAHEECNSFQQKVHSALFSIR